MIFLFIEQFYNKDSNKSKKEVRIKKIKIYLRKNYRSDCEVAFLSSIVLNKTKRINVVVKTLTLF